MTHGHAPLTEDQLRGLISRLSRSGLSRVPRKASEAETLLALSLLSLDPEGIFDEAEIDAHLTQWLHALRGDSAGVDHVTWRRALVDYGFLRRATDGAIYRIRAEALVAGLTAEAQALDIIALFTQARQERLERQQNFTRTKRS